MQEALEETISDCFHTLPKRHTHTIYTNKILEHDLSNTELTDLVLNKLIETEYELSERGSWNIEPTLKVNGGNERMISNRLHMLRDYHEESAERCELLSEGPYVSARTKVIKEIKVSGSFIAGWVGASAAIGLAMYVPFESLVEYIQQSESTFSTIYGGAGIFLMSLGTLVIPSYPLHQIAKHLDRKQGKKLLDHKVLNRGLAREHDLKKDICNDFIHQIN